MKITFYGHACFRLEGDGLAIVTDPYTPGPEGSGFQPVDEPADIVIMSSATDRFHSDPSHVLGDPTVLNALDLPREGATARGLHIQPFPSMESLSYDLGHDPDACAMYLFTLDGVRVLHMGDVGNPLPAEQIEPLRGNVDVLLALTGGRPTISLDDLDATIQTIQPRAVIPMHYYHARGVLDILPVEAFTDRYPPAQVTDVGGPTLTLAPQDLPEPIHVYVLDQAR